MVRDRQMGHDLTELWYVTAKWDTTLTELLYVTTKWDTTLTELWYVTAKWDTTLTELWYVTTKWDTTLTELWYVTAKCIYRSRSTLTYKGKLVTTQGLIITCIFTMDNNISSVKHKHHDIRLLTSHRVQHHQQDSNLKQTIILN